MSSTTIAALIFGCVFGGALVGMLLRAVLPAHHLSAESRDSVKLGTGLIGTMAALVLGLLVASAKSSYDGQKDKLTQMTANVMLLDRVLAHCEPEARASRELLRRAVDAAINRIWSGDRSAAAQIAPPTSAGDDLYDALHQLAAASESHRAPVAQAQSLYGDLGRTRMLLFAQSADSAISIPFLVVVVFWLTIIFVSFGLFAPRNGTVLVAFVVCALSVSGAVFLILELDHPFDGLIRISSAPLRSALAHLGQ